MFCHCSDSYPTNAFHPNLPFYPPPPPFFSLFKKGEKKMKKRKIGIKETLGLRIMDPSITGPGWLCRPGPIWVCRGQLSPGSRVLLFAPFQGVNVAGFRRKWEVRREERIYRWGWRCPSRSPPGGVGGGRRRPRWCWLAGSAHRLSWPGLACWGCPPHWSCGIRIKDNTNINTNTDTNEPIW